MSRARPIKLDNGTIWFDTNRNGERATDEHLEILAQLEGVDLDDLLDDVVTQGEVLRRLKEALGSCPVPPEIYDRIHTARARRQVAPRCRCCGAEGKSTRHHYVNKWILRELSHYASKWADRSKNCIPACIDCHRKLHDRANGKAKSIADLLTDAEKVFAHKAISALLHERPTVFELLVHGDANVYEAQLVKDWCEGKFIVTEQSKSLEQAA